MEQSAVEHIGWTQVLLLPVGTLLLKQGGARGERFRSVGGSSTHVRTLEIQQSKQEVTP